MKGTQEEEAALREYVAAKKAAKKTVDQTQQCDRRQFGEKVDTKEGQR